MKKVPPIVLKNKKKLASRVMAGIMRKIATYQQMKTNEKKTPREPPYNKDLQHIKMDYVCCEFEGCNAQLESFKLYYKHLIEQHLVFPYRCLVSGCGARFETK